LITVPTDEADWISCQLVSSTQVSMRCYEDLAYQL
jgi:hypothetical protein